MVCFVNDSFSKEKQSKMADKDNEINDLTTDENDYLNLKLQRVSGGSIINFPPIFSPSGE